MITRLPRLDQYSAAVQNPRTAFKDPVLQAARVGTNPFGLPLVAGGGFTCVFPFEGAGKKWAVRCFHKQMTDLQGRYKEISSFLAQNPRDYFVEAAYLAEGIRVDSVFHPIIRMPWVEGYTINAFIERQIGQPQQFERLAKRFAEMMQELEQLGVAHGDLQHGNIMVNGGNIKLIDYDGMFIPALKGATGTNIGHVNFQHPTRRETDFHARIDRFSAILIYLALRGLALKPDLWKTYGAGGENLLFQQADFIKPDTSKLLADLERLPGLQHLIPPFRKICRATLDSLPSLSDFLNQQGAQLVPAPHITTTLRRQYEVIRATDLTSLRDHFGDRIEVVGQIINVAAPQQAVNGQPFIFVDFGNWRNQCFRLVIWSTGLDLFRQAGLNITAYQGAWVSVTGNIERFIDKYGNERLQIVSDLPSQIERLSGEAEAKKRLAANKSLGQGAIPPKPPKPIDRWWVNQPGGASGSHISPPKPAPRPTPICTFCKASVRIGGKFCNTCGRESTATRFTPGQKLKQGRYTIDHALSRGGMGEIYIATAHDPTLADRKRVIKVMLDYFDPSNQQKAKAAGVRFRQEARTLSSLQHKHIPDIYEYFEEGNDACIVMEYIQGHDLEQRLTHKDSRGGIVRGQAYRREDVIGWGITLCQLLEYLSVQKPPVIHQDIKPANLLRSDDGTIYLVDFGTARTQIAQAGQAGITQASIYGTPGYAPPEQYQGKTEPRSDVYALAATLYHLATDDDPREQGASPLFHKLSDLAELGQILRGALQSDVSQRPSAQMLRSNLELLRSPKASSGQPSIGKPATPPPVDPAPGMKQPSPITLHPRKVNVRWVGAVMLGIVLLGAFLAFGSGIFRSPQTTVAPTIPLVESTPTITSLVTQVVTATEIREPTATLDRVATEIVGTQATAAQATVSAEPTAVAVPTATLASTSSPVPTVASNMGTVVHGGNMRDAPGGSLLGTVCPSDSVTYLSRQGDWLSIRIERTAADCVPDRVKAGTSGWVHQSLLSPPQRIVPTTSTASPEA